MLVIDYFKQQFNYSLKYGPKTVVLIQVGSFLEVYEFDPTAVEAGVDNQRELELSPDELAEVERLRGHHIGHSTALSITLNMILSSKNSYKPHSLTNPYLVGFPVAAYERHRTVLLNNSYTIIRIDQTGTKTGKEFDRAVGEIVSPSTAIEAIASLPLTNNIMSLYLDVQKRASRIEDCLLIGGLSIIDVSTGTNSVNQVFGTKDDPAAALQEVYRFLLSFSPRELIVHLNNVPESLVDEYPKFLISTLELDRYPTMIIKVNEIQGDYLKVPYQQQFLAKIFKSSDQPSPSPSLAPPSAALASAMASAIGPKRPNLNIIERLGLERSYYGIVSYIVLLQYCYEQNETILTRISSPDTLSADSNQHLILTHNALLQLNILSSDPSCKSKEIDSLFAVVNATSTNLGRRYLRSMLTAPITSTTELEAYYDLTDEMMTAKVGEVGLIELIEARLKRIPDLERYQRKLVLMTIKPIELCVLFRAYLEVIELYRLVMESGSDKIGTLLFRDPYIGQFNDCLTTVLSLFDLDALRSAKIVGNRLEFDSVPVRLGVDSTVDQLMSQLQTSEQALDAICGHLNTFLTGSKGRLIEYTSPKKPKSKSGETDGEAESVGELGFGFLQTTVSKANTIKKALGRIDTKMCGQLEFKVVKSTVSITSPVIEEHGLSVETSRISLEQYVYGLYRATVGTVSSYEFFGPLNQFVAKLDFIKSNAKTAITYRYYRPTIVPSVTVEGRSSLKCLGIRNPIIERIISSEYVQNDISLGTEECQGILVYALNGTGKSALMRSVALNVILAQAGCFVAGRLTFTPYTKILTRLSTGDNLFKHQSSFTVEMLELRTILRTVDSSSLILSDELSKGSETASAMALTIATIGTLLDRQSSFLFSSHLHEIPTNPHVLELLASGKKLRICHLSTVYDSGSNTMVYGRKIEEGSGGSLYGVETARSLDIDAEFIKKALEIRRGITGVSPEIATTKKSRYNSKIYVDSCAMCSKSVGLETHHLNEQKHADAEGYIGEYHKNSSFNLIVLCKTCHVSLHSSKLRLVKQSTSSGVVLKSESEVVSIPGSGSG